MAEDLRLLTQILLSMYIFLFIVHIRFFSYYSAHPASGLHLHIPLLCLELQLLLLTAVCTKYYPGLWSMLSSVCIWSVCIFNYMIFRCVEIAIKWVTNHTVKLNYSIFLHFLNGSLSFHLQLYVLIQGILVRAIIKFMVIFLSRWEKRFFRFIRTSSSYAHPWLLQAWESLAQLDKYTKLNISDQFACYQSEVVKCFNYCRQV